MTCWTFGHHRAKRVGAFASERAEALAERGLSGGDIRPCAGRPRRRF